MVISQLVHEKRKIHAYSLTIGQCTRATFGKRRFIAGHPSGQRITHGLLMGFGYEVAERGESCELAIGEEFRKVAETIVWRFKIARILRQNSIGIICRPIRCRGIFLMLVSRQVHTSISPFSYNCHKMGRHSPHASLLSNIGKRNRRTTAGTHCTLTVHSSFKFRFAAKRMSGIHLAIPVFSKGYRPKQGKVAP